MAKKLYEETNIKDIANALREVNGTETKYKTSEMGDAVRAVGGSEIEHFFLEVNYFKCDSNKTITKTPLLDCSNINSLLSSFQNCTYLKEVYLKNTQNVTDWRYSFYNASYLETIETLDMTSAASLGTFITSDFLKNVKFVPNTIKVNISLTSKKLTDESIQSIINGLADLTGQTTQTLTLHADVKAKLTQEQIATITSKNWTLA